MLLDSYSANWKNAGNAFWLMKTEPDVFSFETLVESPHSTAPWDGVRNYQARNFMRDNFRVGDQVLVYLSNANPSGVDGIATVVRTAYPDPTALDPTSEYFDPKSAKVGQSRWSMVDIKAKAKFRNFLSLDKLRTEKPLQEMLLFKRGMRLSIQPLTSEQFDHIVRLGDPIVSHQNANTKRSAIGLSGEFIR